MKKTGGKGKGKGGGKQLRNGVLSAMFDNLDARRANLRTKVAAVTKNKNTNKPVTGVQVRRNDTVKSQKEKRAEKIAEKRGTKAGSKGEKPKKEVKASLEDLDSDMAAYWFKAGKGEDPAKVSLDQDLDSYFQQQKKDVETTEVAVSDAVEPEVAAE